MRRIGMLALGVGLAACSASTNEPEELAPRALDESLPPSVSAIPAPLDAAHCDVQVDGAGLLDLEQDYLPNVVRCENGGANLEALKAQAIAARSVAYYAIETDGSICDSQGCQVYTCAGEADAIHHQAVDETSGMYLKYEDILTYGFYVAGVPNVSTPSCVGAPGGGPTEHYVTYNDGQSGTDVEQTDLGFVHDPADGGYGQNRGCMSQWGARCLENDNGYDYVEILQFFYGADIEIVQAEGECVMGVDPPGDTGGDAGTDDGVDPDAGDDTAAEDGADSGGDDVDPDGGDAADGGVDDDGADAADDDDGGADDGDVDDGGGGGGGGGGTAGGDDGPGALPDTFGGDSVTDDGCACHADGSRSTPSWAWLSLIALGLVRRRR